MKLDTCPCLIKIKFILHCFKFNISLECRISPFLAVLSVSVDGGECTDAIQHKNRGDAEVTPVHHFSFPSPLKFHYFIFVHSTACMFW